MSAPLPLYQQVKNYISERIDSGEWPPETRVPSEHEIVSSLGVSRMTAHRALRELTAEGRIIRVQGVGTFVAEPKPQAALLEIRSIAEEIAERGGRHASRVIALAAEAADEALAEAMNLPRGAQVFHSIVVHMENGRPIQIEDRHANPALAPDYLSQDFRTTTPSAYLLAVAPLNEAEHVVEAKAADAEEAQLLEIAPGDPCLVLHRRTWADDRVVTRARFVHPGANYRLGGRFRPARNGHPLVG
jgi:GntR family histidine utilization transcriptional repressor